MLKSQEMEKSSTKSKMRPPGKTPVYSHLEGRRLDRLRLNLAPSVPFEPSAVNAEARLSKTSESQPLNSCFSWEIRILNGYVELRSSDAVQND
ncbi:MAG: hypothetical protein A2283_12500 [Lentisphaerae bacterium RIFOXYA12_FULL_48_11]|nr:MAG: hypothetical protein A2283_12500 [Lentisphaerae bacterium RIFOXYA12_FULL_48_11]